MAVTPLTNPPVPANSNLTRGMYVWVTTNASQDPLNTDASQQNLINFCGTNGVNMIFLDIWNYLGGNNYTNAKASTLRKFLDLAHRSGVKVFALTGNTDWGLNHAWVMKNILYRLNHFNAMGATPTSSFVTAPQFDGVMYDVEYWTVPGTDNAANAAGFLDLMKATKKILGLGTLVGCFAGFYLKDTTNTRWTMNYNGKTAQDGEHIMDVADFTVVGTYRNHAANNGTDGPGQISLFQPWYEYASQSGINKSLLAGSETTNVSPAYITYFGATKSAMEAEHTLISATYSVSSNSVFWGQSVHSYDGWKVMP